VISFDQITNSVNFFPVTNAFVKKGSDEFLEIRLNHGKIIRVHCGHPLLVLKDGELKTISSRDAKIGDLIPVPQKLPLRETQKQLNLIKLMKNLTAYDRLYISGANDRLIETLNKKVEPQLIWEWKKYRNNRNKKTMGISIKYFDMASASPDNSMTITCGQKGRDHIPAVLPLDYNLGYVLGWYIADGTISRSSRVVFYPGYEENEARKIFHALNRLGIKCIINHRRINENILWYVIVNSTIFAHMISLLGGGKDAYTKRVPDIAFNASQEFREGMIVGYWNGDGHLRKHGKKSFMAKAITVSRDLVYSLHLLLKTLEIDSSIGMFRLSHHALIKGRKVQTRDSYELRILAGPGKIKFRKFFERLSELDNQITKYANTCVVYEPIKKIISLQIDSDLYDIEVAQTSNFLHGAAAFTHNSSVHGSDIKSALTRLAAEPINIKLSQQMLLWFAIHSTRLKNIDGKTMRRIKTLT
ncbi:MAG: LAGLIDADG family homing endonuclease, partial [Nitrosotalea sp.]